MPIWKRVEQKNFTPNLVGKTVRCVRDGDGSAVEGKLEMFTVSHFKHKSTNRGYKAGPLGFYAGVSTVEKMSEPVVALECGGQKFYLDEIVLFVESSGHDVAGLCSNFEVGITENPYKRESR